MTLGRRMLLGTAAALPAFGLAEAQEALRLTLAGGSVGGAWSAIGNAIGEAIRREHPGTAFSYEPGRDAANVTLVSQGRVQLGIAHAQIALRAIKGEAPFDRAMPDIRGVSLIDSEARSQPLSDVALAAELQAQGVRIARRTVTKYRRMLKLPPAEFRKAG